MSDGGEGFRFQVSGVRKKAAWKRLGLTTEVFAEPPEPEEPQCLLRRYRVCAYDCRECEVPEHAARLRPVSCKEPEPWPAEIWRYSSRLWDEQCTFVGQYLRDALGEPMFVFERRDKLKGKLPMPVEITADREEKEPCSGSCGSCAGK